ncbi:MAG: ATP-grasp domain-containing protein [Candidatus Marinimicrobia bacterium]|nr:ATP-grasp domain-containing protein [Candidatus Neomarinimicrobiota bacterium]
MHIGLCYDLRADYLAAGFAPEDVAEFDSEETLGAIESALARLGHQPERIGNARRLCERLAGGARWDLVFNIAEGLYGRCREAQAPALLELYDIPYTFSDPLTCALTLDKALAKRLVRAAGLNTPADLLVADPAAAVQAAARVPGPWFIKPNTEGTGKGIDGQSRVEQAADLAPRIQRLLMLYRQPVLVESYLPGREFTVGIVGTGAHARPLGCMEILIRPDAPNQDYTYDIKDCYEQYVTYERPAENELRAELETLALAAYRVLECRDAGRVDLRLDANGRPAFMEVNPLAGLHPRHSDLPMIARQEGGSFDQLIATIVASARERMPAQVIAA